MCKAPGSKRTSVGPLASHFAVKLSLIEAFEICQSVPPSYVELQLESTRENFG
jgi:hypothetical protein